MHEIQTCDGKLLADPIEGLCSGPVVNQNWLVNSATDLSTGRGYSSTDQPAGRPVALGLYQLSWSTNQIS